ncbi:MAG TPA: hypothetical protein VFO10_19565 [Oligoflexus sp.]|uniref:hypothetical protein n=1 Tax=Oligoflexus sp. TaxID=1971216 RepID=UPI002D7E8F06|nr:hypothetical protein [Oligoflexus sp.]HET9239470.1 hypothetical protein [Oligoflexus sp.]
MPIPELCEPFEHRGRELLAVFTEFDEKAEGFEPGRLTRVIRILILDEDAVLMESGDVIRRLRTGQTYLLKPKKMSGAGLVEIDLHPVDGRSVERTF